MYKRRLVFVYILRLETKSVLYIFFFGLENFIKTKRKSQPLTKRDSLQNDARPSLKHHYKNYTFPFSDFVFFFIYKNSWVPFFPPRFNVIHLHLHYKWARLEYFSNASSKIIFFFLSFCVCTVIDKTIKMIGKERMEKSKRNGRHI